MVPVSPQYEVALWYEYYFQLERGRAGLAANRREIAQDAVGAMVAGLGFRRRHVRAHGARRTTTPIMSTS